MLTLASPVAHVAEVEVKSAVRSPHDLPLLVAKGIKRNTVPINIIAKNAKIIRRVGLTGARLNNDFLIICLNLYIVLYYLSAVGQHSAFMIP